jgi:predicted nuclease with TOPRIM domain
LCEKETEAKNLQEQTMQLQSELSRLRQDLQDRTTQEEQLRQQITEKEEKTRKAIVAAKSKIAHLAGKFLYLLRFELSTTSWLCDTGLKLNGEEESNIK